MSNPKTSQQLNIDTLNALRDGALSFAQTAEEALKIMESHPLACFNLKSGLAGIDRLKSFQDALSQAILYHRTGRPLETDQLKSRSTAKEKATTSSSKKKKSQPSLRVAENRSQEYKDDDSQ